MKKNPLLILLGISLAFFLVFMGFVYFVLQNFVSDGDSPLMALNKGGSIGVVEVDGVIMESKKIVQQLKRFEKDRSIKGIILRVDSPGGAVGPSQEIHDAILKIRETKPVVASMESVAASGGLYIAVAAERVVANPGTITGSIGVIMNFINLAQLYDWAKVKRYVVKSGKYKDLGSDLREMSEEERALVQEMIDNVNMQFMTAVAKGRKLSIEKVKEIATGRIYTGEQAFQLKLVDKLGGLDMAVSEMKALAKLDGEPELVYPRPKRQSLAEALGAPISNGIADHILRRLGLNLPESADAAASLPRGLLYLAPGF